MTSPQTNLTFPQGAVTVYREYGPSVDFPSQVFTLGPQSVSDYQCEGSYQEEWRLFPETVDGVLLSSEGSNPRLAISDTAILTEFKLVITGFYTFNGETNSTTIELSYNIESLFSAEFLRLSVVETQSTEAYSFIVAQQSTTRVNLSLNMR